MKRIMAVLGLGLSAVVGCSEAKSDDGEGGSSGDTTGTQATGGTTSPTTGTTTTGTQATTSPATTGTEATASTGAVVAGDLVINEISATDDYIELFNTGAAAYDLGGKVLADLDGDTMGPKLGEAISFPAGTSIAPGGYLFILAKQDGVAPGEQAPQTTCAPGASPCFYAPFGLSDSDGDAVFLLDGGTIVAQADYPPAAAPEGQTWCRLPDGTGAFAPCTPTPSAANAAP